MIRIRPVHVAHAIPGRVRIRFQSHEADAVDQLLNELRGWPGIKTVTWNRTAKSLAVTYDSAFDYGTVLGFQSPAPRRTIPIDWTRVAAAAVFSLLPLGPLAGAALAAATEIVEQRRAAQTA